MVAGVEIHDQRRGERDRATAATTVERSPSVSPSDPLIFFSSEIGEARGYQWGWAFLSCFHLAGERRRSP